MMKVPVLPSLMKLQDPHEQFVDEAIYEVKTSATILLMARDLIQVEGLSLKEQKNVLEATSRAIERLLWFADVDEAMYNIRTSATVLLLAPTLLQGKKLSQNDKISVVEASSRAIERLTGLIKGVETLWVSL